MSSYTLELPHTTFTQSHVIKDREHDLHIEFHGREHTSGDVFVFCPQKRTVATGDMILGFLPNLTDANPRDWPQTIDSVGQLAADCILPGHGAVQPDHQRMIQMRNYIEELTGLIETGKKAGKPLAELQNIITISSLKTLKANGYSTYVDENLKRFSVYLGPRTPLEDRLRANVEAVYRNLDRA